jgi:hypothetical protein
LTTRKGSAGEDHSHGHCSLSYSEEAMLRAILARSLDDVTMSDNVMRERATALAAMQGTASRQHC